MENLTYEMYLANLAIREEIEREGRRARAEGMRRFVAAPLARTIARLFTSARPKPPAQPEIGLARGNVLRVENARNMRVRVARGMLWITQEDDPSDVVLERGESFLLDRDGVALLHACGGAPQTLISLAPAV